MIPLKNIISGYESPTYPTEDGGEIKTGLKFIERSLSGSMTSRKKKLLSLGILRFFARLGQTVSYTGTRGYGALFLSYGLLTVTLELAKEYFGVSGTEILFPSILGAMLTILAIPLLMMDKPFCIAMQDFAVTDYVFFEFFSIKRMHRQTQARAIPPFVMAIIGALLAALGTFLGARTVFAALAAVVAIYLSFIAPEFAFFSTIIMLPLVSAMGRGMLVLTCMIVAAFISFMRKVVFGKRVYSIEQYDVLTVVFVFFMLLSGIFMQGLDSFESSVSLLLLALGYPLASNLIANRRLAENALGAVVISSLLTLGYTAFEVAKLLVGGGVSALEGYSARATFDSPGAFAAFILAAIFSVGYFAATSKRRFVRVMCVPLLLIYGAMLILTGRADGVLALLAGVLAYMMIRRVRRRSGFVFLLLPLPLVVLLLPVGLFDFMPFAFGGFEYNELWGASFKMLGDHLLLGVGMGSDSFSSAILDYGQVAGNSSSLFLEVACEAGIFALVALLVLFAVRFLHFAVYGDYISHSRVTHLAKSAFVMLFAMLALGMTDYFWSDTAVYYLFWCVFGIGSAALRIAKREHDDKVMYYGDLMSVDSSVMDVKLK